MRCLVVADLHYALPQFDWVLNIASRFDVVIIAGDALDIASVVDFRAQIVVVRKYLERLAGKTRVILCSGNHDLDERDEAGERVSRWIGDLGNLVSIRKENTEQREKLIADRDALNTDQISS